MSLNWQQAAAEIRTLVLSGERDLSSDTIGNAKDFLTAASLRFMPPTSIDFGYWPTLSVSWDVQPPIEVEIFDDRYEFYRFLDGQTDIEEIAHRPGEPFPERLAALLSSGVSAQA